MKFSMQKFDISRIKSFYSFSLSLVLIFQISLAGVALSFGSDGNMAVRGCHNESCEVLVFCLEDIEDKNINFLSLSLNLYVLSDVKLFSIDTNPLNDYIHSLNHSRSPPVS